MSVFAKATRAKKKLRMALAGPSGSGKTYSALRIASSLGGRTVLIDTEHGSGTLYSDDFEYDHCDLPSHDPRIYCDYIALAEKEGYDTIIIDSFSHAWMGKGGALEILDNLGRSSNGNNFANWRHVTPLHNALVDAVLSCKAHVIVTMRAKQDYQVEKDPTTGKNVVRKLGLAPLQRDGVEYEFDVTGDMNMQNELVIAKTRCKHLAGKVFSQPGREIGEILKNWLGAGVDSAPSVSLAPDMVSRIVAEFQRIQASPERIRKALSDRGVSAVEHLSNAQASEMLDRLGRIASPPVAAPAPQEEPSPAPSAPDDLAASVEYRANLISNLAKLAEQQGYSAIEWEHKLSTLGIKDLGKASDDEIIGVIVQIDGPNSPALPPTLSAEDFRVDGGIRPVRD